MDELDKEEEDLIQDDAVIQCNNQVEQLAALYILVSTRQVNYLRGTSIFPRGAAWEARGSEISHHHQILTNALHLAATAFRTFCPVHQSQLKRQ